jgi:hypothetical protein
MKIFEFFRKYMENMVGTGAGAGAGAGTFEKLEPEPPQKWTGSATLRMILLIFNTTGTGSRHLF